MSGYHAPAISVVLGDILTACGIIPLQILTDALAYSDQTKLPLGRTLVVAGYLGEGDLTSALRAAQMVREGRISMYQAISAMRDAYEQCIPIQHVLDEILDYSPCNKLAQLLLAARVVSPMTLLKLERHCECTGQTLGEILLKYGMISTRLLDAALEIVSLEERGTLTHQQAIEALRASCSAGLTVPDAVARITGSPLEMRMRLGRLLSRAGIIGETEVLDACERALQTGCQIGQLLFETARITPVVLRAALSLQSMLCVGSISDGQAVEVLHLVHTQQIPVEHVLDQLQELRGQLIKLLDTAGIVNDADIERAMQICKSRTNDPARALIAAKIVELRTIKAAVRCLTLLHGDQISMETAINALQQIHRSGIPFEEAIDEKAMTQKPRAELFANDGAVVAIDRSTPSLAKIVVADFERQQVYAVGGA